MIPAVARKLVEDCACGDLRLELELERLAGDERRKWYESIVYYRDQIHVLGYFGITCY